MQHQQAKLEWHDTGVPVSKQFDDPYFSLENGLEETRHVFLSGNGLPARFTDGFHIAELGFGTGLNLLASWQAWRDYGCSGKLHFTSFELFPMDPDEMAKSLDLFPVDQDLAGRLVAALRSGETRIETDDLVFNLVIGDARKSVPAWQASADAWFLDGFSPAKNPELWEATEADLQAQALIQSKGLPLSERVRAIMLEMFTITEPKIAHVCGRLKVSRSTLLRRLAEEGVTFQSLLDQTRKDLAIRYLVKSDLNNQQIAHLVGYRDPNAFQRAFRKWTGMTPQALRADGAQLGA